MTTKIKPLLLNALKQKYKAKKDEALATIEVYLNNPAGIGEHPQIIDEISKLLEELSSAEDVLEVLETKYQKIED